MNRVFSRRATGLAREIAPHHAFIYNMMAVGLIGFTEAVLFSYAPAVLPGADVGIGIVTTVLAAIPFYVAVAMLACSMPRAGGDYVWQSRVLSPLIGFGATFSAWTVWQWFFAAFLGEVMVTLGFQPFFALLAQTTGSQGYAALALNLAEPNTIFLITTIILILGLLVGVAGIRFYVRLQYVLFAGALASLLTLLGLLVTHTHQDFVNSFNSYMAPIIGPNPYQTIIQAGSTSGLSLSPPFSWANTMTLWAIAWLSLGYSSWSIYNSSEIKLANRFRPQVFQIIGAYIAIGAIWAVTWYAYSNVVGLDFIRAFNGLWFSSNPGPVNSVLAITPNPFFPYIGSLLTKDPFIFGVILLGAVLGYFQVVIIIYFASTRILMAASLDRVLPDRIGHVSAKYSSPSTALIVSFLGCEVWLYFVTYQFPAIGPYVASAGFGTEVAYIFLCLTAIIFPYRLRHVYELSPIAKYRLGKVPLISILGVLALIFNLYLTYQYVAGPNLFLTYPLLQSDEFVAALFIVCLMIYPISRMIRRRQGIDIGAAFIQIPPE